VQNLYQGKKGNLCVYDSNSEHEEKYHLFICQNELICLITAFNREIWRFREVILGGVKSNNMENGDTKL
jgi:hypothetical protein